MPPRPTPPRPAPADADTQDNEQPEAPDGERVTQLPDLAPPAGATRPSGAPVVPDLTDDARGTRHTPPPEPARNPHPAEQYGAAAAVGRAFTCPNPKCKGRPCERIEPRVFYCAGCVTHYGA